MQNNKELCKSIRDIVSSLNADLAEAHRRGLTVTQIIAQII